MKRHTARTMTDLPSAMGLSARLALARARARGVAIRPLLEQSRLSVDQLKDVRVRVPVHNQIDFLNRVANALGDDLLGVNLALQYELRKGGLFYYVLASSDTLLPSAKWPSPVEP